MFVLCSASGFGAESGQSLSRVDSTDTDRKFLFGLSRTGWFLAKPVLIFSSR